MREEIFSKVPETSPAAIDWRTSLMGEQYAEISTAGASRNRESSESAMAAADGSSYGSKVVRSYCFRWPTYANSLQSLRQKASLPVIWGRVLQNKRYADGKCLRT